MTRHAIAYISAALLVGVTACSTTGARSDDYVTSQLVGKGDPGADAIVAGNTAFAIDLYHQLSTGEAGARTSENLFFSPASISTAFGLVYGGAREETKTEISDVLHFTLADDRFHDAMSAVLSKLEIDWVDLVLTINNALWADKAAIIAEEYLALTAEHYDAGDLRVDYRNDHLSAIQTINHWVEEKTNDKISELLSPDDINEKTRVSLINTIYMKAPWLSAFREAATSEMPFTRADGDQVTTEMMHQTTLRNYAKTNDFQILSMPYRAGVMSMIVLLPRQKNGLAKAEQSLTSSSIKKALDKLAKGDAALVDLKLPKWKMEQKFKLKQNFREMGMIEPFSDSADFSGIMDPAKQPDNTGMKIGDVIHQTFIEVDEKGTEAAAVTAINAVMITGGRRGPPPKRVEFHADHPFIFLIRNRRTGMILFVGRMNDPTE